MFEICQSVFFNHRFAFAELLSEEGVVEWSHQRESMEDAIDSGEDHDAGTGTVSNAARVKLFREPHVQAFVAWVQEEEDDDEDDEEEEESDDEDDEE